MQSDWPTNMLGELQRHVTPHNIAYLVGSIILVKGIQWSYWPIRRLFSPLGRLPGPKTESLIWGNLKQVLMSSNLNIYEQWSETYGSTFAYRGLFFSYRLLTTDIRALTLCVTLELPSSSIVLSVIFGSIMSQSDSFPKPDNFRQGLAGFLGQEPIIWFVARSRALADLLGEIYQGSSEAHPGKLHMLTNITQLKDVLLNLAKSHAEEGIAINVLPWISHTTLDIIGVAGFDYHFNSLDNDGKNELSAAFRTAFQSGQPAGAFMILQRFVPIIRYLSPDERSRAQAAASSIMHRIGTKLVAEKKASLDHELKTGSTAQGRDLLTLLIKSNMSNENEGQRMTDDEVLAQISTFLFAGHETTSTSTAWALYALTQHPGVQRKLRQELLESGLGDEPSIADLDKLSYLDNVVHEVLRLYPAVPATVREAAHEVHIPTSQAFKDGTGVESTSILVQKGDMVILPILAMNRNKEIWGEDSTKFRYAFKVPPDRWDNLPEAAKAMPGVWGHLMTFIQGNRSCIGYRFAVAEMKALLYTLVRAIEFDIDPSIKLESKSLSARPLVVSHPELGNQMPLICKPVLVI
ncbi:hypothetical protein FRC12_005437 [Ceratobasidium sp. 428]|nr:hypothetical protein FRC12_005437 [Ceratobasidium sp. 428]